ncbi:MULTISPECIES: Na+/H+ antiporter NhaC [Mammaliicoccus]|uniref:Na+/H+ antiporter NhaC n=2 Tax=Mammaliicoccus fleurettii TaxID=150056 RepID=A0ABS5MLQ5_9STAP|nr:MULTISPECIES: Na+/H+ antiporter NhaC [Mammaliicoccus]HCN61058.1 Na+/H+ antiporter NhaC [Staphylococcus sp.]MBL0846361.1 Na+/H+ antiporter NhaC [Mammaliicoccus fleurettii]MBS3671437.1 Na+/H+ antiporter NhaC [Mammaliicoccus fleurettii]MBS3696609.1 Na+/H+ antiporter NhaC [Mammaliicoccus fleurettii]MBW0766110.1 Na+/H+ antiporter NhaC [Mammaliicoccus fleurettii]
MKRLPTLFEAISSIVVMGLVVLVGFGILHYPIQPLLIIAAVYASFIAFRVGLSWEDLQDGITKRLATAMPAIYIIFSVGILIGTWMFSGTVPALIYYGLELINPTYFLVTAFIITAVTSVATGTAWGSVGTAGIALIAIASEMNIPTGMVAGVVIAGGVFGDKMSPLSDTTNLAALVTKVNIFKHIQHMMWTTIPASIIGLIVWFIAGLQFSSENIENKRMNILLNNIGEAFNLNFWVWLPVIVIVAGISIGKPTVPMMLLSSLVAMFVGVINNGFEIVDAFNVTMNGFDIGMTSLSSNEVSNSMLDLVKRGGIMSMTEIVVTIFCGYAFAGIVEASGSLKVILTTISSKVSKDSHLILVTIAGSLILVFAAGVASVVIIMIGVLLMDMYNERKLDRVNLSRTLEDCGTMVLPFIPWGTSGIYYRDLLHVSLGDFFWWAVPCYLCVFFAAFYGITGIGIKKIKA